MSARSRRGLNRGLSALFEEAEGDGASPAGAPTETAPPEPVDDGSLRESVPIDLVDPNPSQPRKRMEEESLQELVQSIRTHGILQPLLLRPSPSTAGRFEIVAGERRWRAAQRAGVHAVPARISELSASETLQVALVENLQRSDLNPVEEARGYRELVDSYGHSQKEVSRVVGKSRAHVANTLRLLQLPAEVLGHLESGRLLPGHARPLIGRPDAVELAGRILREDLSVREIEALVRDPGGGSGGGRSRPKKDPDTLEMEQSLSEAVGYRVAIRDQNGRGEVRISYANYEELDGIAGRLAGMQLESD